MTSTKITATASVKREEGKSTIVLSLEPPFHAYLQEGDKVFVELSTMNGADVEFYEFKEKPKVLQVTTVEEMSDGGEEAKKIFEESKPSESVKVEVDANTLNSIKEFIESPTEKSESPETSITE